MKLVQAIKTLLGKLVAVPPSSKMVVIGTQMAEARAAQQRHEELHASHQSPLADVQYSSVESSLWRWADSPFDNQIEILTADFAALDEADRRSLRDSLTTDDFYTLLTFARRCALATLRGGNGNMIEPAFVALAMIDLERIDWRDLLVANWLISYAGERMEMPIARLVKRTMQLAEPRTAKIVKQRQGSGIDLAAFCGYQEVNTREGMALFETGYAPFSPMADLSGIAFECAVALEENGYEIGSVQVATDLPLIWLDGSEGSAIAKLVQNISGCVSISGVPRADPAPRSSGQSLLIFLAEAASENDAREIAAAAQKRSGPLATQLGIASRRTCAVVIQRSWMADTPPLEDARSLERLRVVFEGLLG